MSPKRRASEPPKPVRVVFISDTHGLHDQLSIPGGDVLIHGGDLTRDGSLGSLAAVNAFLETLSHPHKLVIAGNHDFCLEREPAKARALITHATYLQDQGVTLAGLRFWGSPWQPWFYDWAFNLPRGGALREKWDLIPVGTDVLVTHGPPMGHGDLTSSGQRAGCEDLLEAVERLRPRYHLFGHIHEGYGITQAGETTFVNGSVCDLGYRPVNPPVVFELVPQGPVGAEEPL